MTNSQGRDPRTKQPGRKTPAPPVSPCNSAAEWHCAALLLQTARDGDSRTLRGRSALWLLGTWSLPGPSGYFPRILFPPPLPCHYMAPALLPALLPVSTGKCSCKALCCPRGIRNPTNTGLGACVAALAGCCPRPAASTAKPPVRRPCGPLAAHSSVGKHCPCAACAACQCR